MKSESRPDTLRLIFIPALISLGVTLLRLAGELLHWSPAWFSPETSGTRPVGPFTWVVGITWLAIPFGAYFAVKLCSTGGKRPSMHVWPFTAIAGLVIMVASPYLLRLIPVKFPQLLIFIWLFMAIAAILQYFAWPELFKTLLAYGFAARIPVVIVMLLAMMGNWGTHYDYVGLPPQFMMPLLPRFLWLAFFPQLVFWVGFTIVAGSAAGLVATVAMRLRTRAVTQTKPDKMAGSAGS